MMVKRSNRTIAPTFRYSPAPVTIPAISRESNVTCIRGFMFFGVFECYTTDNKDMQDHVKESEKVHPQEALISLQIVCIFAD